MLSFVNSISHICSTNFKKIDLIASRGSLPLLSSIQTAIVKTVSESSLLRILSIHSSASFSFPNIKLALNKLNWVSGAFLSSGSICEAVEIT